MSVLERLSENLNLLMKKNRVTTNSLARQTNIPASTIKKLRNKSNTNPTLATLLPISRFFSVTVEQLIHHDLSIHSAPLTIKPIAFYLPILDWEDSINWPTKKPESTVVEIVSEQAFSPSAFALRIHNNDAPLFPLFSLLLIEPEISPENNDFIVVHKKGHTTPMLKQFLIEDDLHWLRSPKIMDNITQLTDDFRIIGVIIECRHTLKSENNTYNNKVILS